MPPLLQGILLDRVCFFVIQHLEAPKPDGTIRTWRVLE